MKIIPLGQFPSSNNIKSNFYESSKTLTCYKRGVISMTKAFVIAENHVRFQS